MFVLERGVLKAPPLRLKPDQVAVIADRTIDTSGLTCPIPILKAKKALAEMEAGSTLEVVATDPAAPKDFEAFCRATGNVLEQSLEDAGAYRFFIRRAR